MKTLHGPIRVTFEQIPGSIAVAYVCYRKRLEGTAPPRTKRISPDVNVDYDDGGSVLGIELVGVDAESLAVAVQFANEHDLVFPRDLSGCAGNSGVA
jgi:uncharacterized protein YuzE